MPEYIDREDYCKNLCHCNNEYCDKESCPIWKAPAADVAPVVHGCWIEYTKVIIPEPYNKWEQVWKCSECGFDDGFVAYNFCPNCGARMDLEVTDNG